MQIIGWDPLLGLAPPLGNPGSATVWAYICKYDSVDANVMKSTLRISVFLFL